MNVATDQMQKIVRTELETAMKTDKLFAKQIDELTFFYGKKLLNKTNQQVQTEYLETNFPYVFNNLFFHGYYVMKTVLTDTETTISEEAWNLSRGHILQEIPLLLKQLLGEQAEIYQTQETHSFFMWVIDNIPGSFDLIKQIRKDVVVYGAFYSFLHDERFKNVSDVPLQDSPYKLANPFKPNFVSPQVYITPEYITDNVESWHVFEWSNLSGKWCGTVQIVNIEGTQKLTFSITNDVALDERYMIFNKVIEMISDDFTDIEAKLLHVERIETK